MRSNTVTTKDIQISGNKLTTSSRIVADRFGRQHKNVLRDIRELNCSKEFHRLNFEPIKIKVLNNPDGEEISEVIMTFDGFVFLVMGYTGALAGEIKEKYIEAFNNMRQQLERLGNPNGTSHLAALEHTLAILKENEARLALVEAKAEQTTTALADQRLTASQVADIENRICAKSKSQKHRAQIKGALKREFLKSNTVSGMTWKDASSSDYAAMVSYIEQFVLPRNWLPIF